jgi:D-tyrosyl-tRNA(Tyr) deacylase
MRAVIQRVRRADVAVNDAVIGAIDGGLLVYLGVGHDDGEKQSRELARKVAELRIFPDEEGKMNLSVQDVRGGVLAVPNFTLLADARKGRRPAFVDAAAPDHAEPLFEVFAAALAENGCKVATGRFGAHMIIRSEADGPVNIVLDLP